MRAVVWGTLKNLVLCTPSGYATDWHLYAGPPTIMSLVGIMRVFWAESMNWKGGVAGCCISIFSLPYPGKTDPFGPLTVTEIERVKFQSAKVLLPEFIYSFVHTKAPLFQGWQCYFLFVSVLNSPDTVKVK